MTTHHTVSFADVEPAEGRKHLSKHRNVKLPVPNFGDQGRPAAVVPNTPIEQALRSRKKHNQSTETLEPPKVVKFRIYLSRMSTVEENGAELSIEGGRTANTAALLYHLAKEYEVDPDAFSELFAIWMISPFLEVQLKPYHRPYECRSGWITLLERFAQPTTMYSFEQDEPILMLRRNACLTNEREFELLDHNPLAARFLIIDAREMLLLNRLHFLSTEDTVLATALMFCLEYGNHNEQVHDMSFIRSHLDDILPERLYDMIATKTLFGKPIMKRTVHEERLLREWKEASKIATVSEKEHKLLVLLTQTSSCYGAAWFTGRIEKKTSRVNVRNFGQTYAEVKVEVGINDRYMTIIDDDSKEILLVQPIEEISWKLAPAVETEPPYLVLNLSSDEEPFNTGGTDETIVFLMIVGNQTILMEALLKTLTGRRLERTISDSSSSDSSTSSCKHASLIQSKVEMKDCSALYNRKLCLAKFQNGKCTELAGSFKSLYSYGQEL